MKLFLRCYNIFLVSFFFKITLLFEGQVIVPDGLVLTVNNLNDDHNNFLQGEPNKKDNIVFGSILVHLKVSKFQFWTWVFFLTF